MFSQLFIITSLAFLLSFVQSRSLIHDDANYAIIFDAGSKGTRLYLFKYSKHSRGSLNVDSLDYNFEQVLYCELNGMV